MTLVGEMTNEEYQVVMHEITKRAMDIWHEKYLSKRELLLVDKSFIESTEGYGKIAIEYRIEMIGNDIIQMLGRIRREKKRVRREKKWM